MPNHASLGVLFCRFILGPLMLVSGCNKLSARADFEKILYYTFKVRRRFSALIARYLPVIEIMVGVSVLVGIKARVASIAAGLLLGLFSGKLLQLYLAGKRKVTCGCFGRGEQEHSALGLVGRNALLVAAALVIAAGPGDFFSLLPMRAGNLQVVPVAVTSVGVILITTILLRARLTFQSARRMTGD